VNKILLLSILLIFNVFAQDDFPDDFDIPDEQNLQDFQGTDIQTNFDTGPQEDQLLQLASKLSYKLTDSEWERIKSNVNVTSTYTVQPGDWLFKISQQLFGTGHYYPKIWALNPIIKNPHQIEPGMVLVFDSSANGATLSMGNGSGVPAAPVITDGASTASWQQEKQSLLAQGVQVDYASPEMQEMVEGSYDQGNRSYQGYQPPDYSDMLPKTKQEVRDGGISEVPITGGFKQGYSINTFVADNEVQELGIVTDAISESKYLSNLDNIFVQFESGTQQKGDTFSLYRTLKKLRGERGDRSGYKTIILAHIKLIKRIEDKWLARVYNVTHSVERGDKITQYTPKIKRIRKIYTNQKIESFVIGTYNDLRSHLTLGDIIYLDRGRRDGVKIGYTFGVFDNRDLNTKKEITDSPAYLKGQATVIGLTDGFSTALVTRGSFPISLYDKAFTLSEKYRSDRDNFTSNREVYPDDEEFEQGLDDTNNDDNFDSALEGDFDQERQDFDLQDQEVDDDGVDFEGLEAELGDIDDLANGGGETPVDIDGAVDSEFNEGAIDENFEREAPLDDDQFNGGINSVDQEIITEDLEQIENQEGKKYLDENINEQENPYGLTESDLEEVDELLNFDSIEE